MGKKDLKKQYPELSFNFVDLISLLDTTPTKKITPFLVKQFNDWIQYSDGELRKHSDEFVRKTFGEPKNEVDEIIKTMLFNWAKPKLEIINEFVEHMENNRLSDNDINNYDNWNHLKLAINEADMKYGVKNKKNRIHILHDEGEWLVLKPLSIEASVNYGYGTKWCTSMKTDNTYFHKYSRDGVLIFVINRKNGIKYAFYSSPNEYSVWTASDARIDSMETTIPFDLLIKIKDWTNFKLVGPNYDYFDEEDKNQPKLRLLRTVQALTNTEREVNEVEIGYEEPMVEMTETESVDVYDEMEDMVIEAENEVEDGRFNVEEFRGEVALPLRMDEDEMVGYNHPVHGSITENGERTWSNPYPNGPGGGFTDDIPSEMPDEVLMEMASEDVNDYDERLPDGN